MSENRTLISRRESIEASRPKPINNNAIVETFGRPLSSYDNLCESNNSTKRSSKDFIFSEIKFQFDKFPPSNNSTENPTVSSATNNFIPVKPIISNMQQNHLENQGCSQTSPKATTKIKTSSPTTTRESEITDITNRSQYENVFDTIQARNLSLENKLFEKPVISDAKSSFFGLNTSHCSHQQNYIQEHPSAQIEQNFDSTEADNDLDQLIMESETLAQIISCSNNNNNNSKNQYENLNDYELSDLNKSSEESTARSTERIGSSSSNASSSSTITPSQSPMRQTGSSTGNISTRSPKFTLPKADGPPSQVSFLCVLELSMSFVEILV